MCEEETLGSIANDVWENCCVVGQHMHNTIFFLRQLYKNGKSSWIFASYLRIPKAWIEDN
jgi:hypothetical protein